MRLSCTMKYFSHLQLKICLLEDFGVKVWSVAIFPSGLYLNHRWRVKFTQHTHGDPVHSTRQNAAQEICFMLRSHPGIKRAQWGNSILLNNECTCYELTSSLIHRMCKQERSVNNNVFIFKCTETVTVIRRGQRQCAICRSNVSLPKNVSNVTWVCYRFHPRWRHNLIQSDNTTCFK